MSFGGKLLSLWIGEKPRKPALAVYIMMRGMSNKHRYVFRNARITSGCKATGMKKLYYRKENMATGALSYTDLKFLDNNSFL